MLQRRAVEAGEEFEDGADTLPTGTDLGLADRDLMYVRKIGGGANGEVWEAVCYGEPAAVKKDFTLTGVYAGIRLAPAELRAVRVKFLRECAVLHQGDHPNVLRLLKVVIDNERHPVGVVLPLLPGTLSTLLGNAKFSAIRKIAVSSDVARGLHYLHDVLKPSVVHRDLKADNVLMQSLPDGTAVIADFGEGKRLVGLSAYVRGTLGGTLVSMAPETHLMRLTTPSCDVFSLGVLILQVMSGNEPDPGPEAEETDGEYQILHEVDRRIKDIADAKTVAGHSDVRADCLELCNIAVACLTDSTVHRPSTVTVKNKIDAIRKKVTYNMAEASPTLQSYTARRVQYSGCSTKPHIWESKIDVLHAESSCSYCQTFAPKDPGQYLQGKSRLLTEGKYPQADDPQRKILLRHQFLMTFDKEIGSFFSSLRPDQSDLAIAIDFDSLEWKIRKVDIP